MMPKSRFNLSLFIRLCLVPRCPGSHPQKGFPNSKLFQQDLENFEP